MSLFEISRRRALAGAAGLALAPAAAESRPATGHPIVTLLGDSITAGYGLAAADALPARLQAELARLGTRARVVPAGVVGDTTAGGLRRLDRALVPGAAVCLVALGGNDLLQGVDPATVRDNLGVIVRRLKARGVKVVLAGLRAPAPLSGAYADAFGDAFAAVARAERVPLVPDMLGGVALNPRLNQADGIHPNAAGVQLIARRLAPAVASALAAR